MAGLDGPGVSRLLVVEVRQRPRPGQLQRGLLHQQNQQEPGHQQELRHGELHLQSPLVRKLRQHLPRTFPGLFLDNIDIDINLFYFLL